MTKSEISKEFDDGSSTILVGTEQFTVNSKLIKTLYHFSNSLIKEIRYIQPKENNSFDRIIDSLHVISGYSSTQRVNQHSINRFLKYILDLDKDERETMNVFLSKAEKTEWLNAIQRLIK